MAKTQGRSCEGKLAFTHAQALDMLQTMRKRSERTNTGNRNHSLKAYGCAFCGHWHIGHNGSPKRNNYKRDNRVRNYRIIENEDYDGA